jgi:hypothetical protein
MSMIDFQKQVLLLGLLSLLLLQGCSSSSRRDGPQRQAALPSDRVGLRPLTPMTQRIIEVSREELLFWRQSPQPQHRITQYWHAVAPKLAEKHLPWSAAFVGYVMHRAGVPQQVFPPAGAHWMYLRHIHAAARHGRESMSLHGVEAYPPQAGDLICARRDHQRPLDIHSPHFRQQLEGSQLHCDIVTARYPGYLEVIGGNVSHRVSVRQIALDQHGYLPVTAEDQWFSVVENRL